MSSASVMTSAALLWPSGLAFPTAAWPSGCARPALTVVISALLIRGSSPARRGLNWPGCARRTVSSGGKRIFSGWRQRTLQKSNCRREVSPDRGSLRSVLHGLALPAAGCDPQQLLRLAATATEPRPTGSGERVAHGPGEDGFRSPSWLLRGTTRPSGAQGRWPQGGPPPHCQTHALFSTQGQDPSRVQAMQKQQLQGCWSG